MNRTIKFLTAGVAAAALSIGGAAYAQADTGTETQERTCTGMFLGEMRWTDGVTFGERPDRAGQGNGECDGECDGTAAQAGEAVQERAMVQDGSGEPVGTGAGAQRARSEDGTRLMDGSGYEGAPRHGR